MKKLIGYGACLIMLLSGSTTDHQQAKSETAHVAYPAYTHLVMAGYQGWFAAEGDDSHRGWYHLKGGRCGGFYPGCATVDFFPDMREYTKTYPTAFSYPDGSPVRMYSAYDEETTDLHFKWMKEYGLDGVHMQRFVGEIKPSNPSGRRHFNHVLSNALKAAKKYGRTISVMYDLSGCRSEDIAYVAEDIKALNEEFKLFDEQENPTFLHHHGKPLISIWGVGFNDNRKYSIQDVARLVDKLQAEGQVSILLGVPYYWRSLDRDTENDPALHELIKKADVIMPWAVGRYNGRSYQQIAGAVLKGDVDWCRKNGVDYVPLVFPGFSWGNMHQDSAIYNAIPREDGDFLWKQVVGAKTAGAQSLYVAMFDEIDEGTAIFKCARQKEVPLNGQMKFMGIADHLPTDHYLWLTGQAATWFHGQKQYGAQQPVRSAE